MLKKVIILLLNVLILPVYGIKVYGDTTTDPSKKFVTFSKNYDVVYHKFLSDSQGGMVRFNYTNDQLLGLERTDDGSYSFNYSTLKISLNFALTDTHWAPVGNQGEISNNGTLDLATSIIH